MWMVSYCGVVKSLLFLVSSLSDDSMHDVARYHSDADADKKCQEHQCVYSCYHSAPPFFIMDVLSKIYQSGYLPRQCNVLLDMPPTLHLHTSTMAFL